MASKRLGCGHGIVAKRAFVLEEFAPMLCVRTKKEHIRFGGWSHVLKKCRAELREFGSECPSAGEKLRKRSGTDIGGHRKSALENMVFANSGNHCCN